MITYRHNIMSVNSLDTFFSIKGGFVREQRDVYFVRALGCGRDMASEILNIDQRMGRQMQEKRLFYTRVKSLVPLTSREDMEFYEKQFALHKEKHLSYVRNQEKDEKFGHVLSDAYLETINKYRMIKKNMTESIEKNFAVKLLYWTDCVLGESLSDWSERKCYKIVAENVQKEQEYLFYFMLTLIGCDVLLLECREDISTIEELKKLSQELRLGEFGGQALPEYKQECGTYGTEDKGNSNKVSAPGRNDRRQQQTPVSSQSQKSFEELALLASSIVMIAVYDRAGQPVATGSGIMIGRDGYILTNNHVTAGGCFFAVRIEDDENVYRTDEIIKYNSVLDLAVIRIGKYLNPLPVYRGRKKLARGQKVVAIGSPLGLFNSVSDGIISGFREIDSVNMIQFTAPISHGSSGGAVLNMQGEVIGISTAGIDSGQNLNLAVSYEDISMFIRGFVN